MSAQSRTTVRRRTNAERLRRILDPRARLPGIMLLAGLLGAWELAGRRASNYVLAPPSEVVSAGRDMIASGELLRALETTLTALAVGFAAAAVVGVSVGYAMGWSRLVGRLLNPYVSAFYVVPIVALVPLIVIWMGFGLASRVLVVFLFCVFEIVVSAYGGIRSVDPVFVDVARTFGAGRVQVLRRVVVPASLPFVFVGLRIAAGRAIKGIVMAEMLFAITGTGALVQRYGAQLRTAQLLVVVVAIALLGVLVSGALQLVERRVLRWRPALRRGLQ